MSRKRPKARCGTPRWTRLRNGQQRCVAVCEGGLWRFLPGSVCAEKEKVAFSAPELLATYTSAGTAVAAPKKRRARRKS